MKRGTVNHPKTCALAAELGLEQWGAAGIVASLFEWTQFYAKRGDIGRHPNAAIARGIGWTGDPDRLIGALVAVHYLDRCRCHRLRVHDWHDHADQTVRRSEEVKKHGLIECYGDASSLLVECEQPTSQPSPSPSPSSSSTPTPSASPSARPDAGSTSADGRQTAPAHPLVKGRRPQLEQDGYDLIREIAAAEERLTPGQSRDPTEVLLQAAGWQDRDGRTRAKARLETMSDDHLIRTLDDLRADLAALREREAAATRRVAHA
jgi:hypothetical protein